ncbi:MAG: hypothetical protein D6725_06845, partial [Planctomycetota bacterium]
ASRGWPPILLPAEAAVELGGLGEPHRRVLAVGRRFSDDDGRPPCRIADEVPCRHSERRAGALDRDSGGIPLRPAVSDVEASQNLRVERRMPPTVRRKRRIGGREIADSFRYNDGAATAPGNGPTKAESPRAETNRFLTGGNRRQTCTPSFGIASI